MSGIGHKPIELERCSQSFKIWKEVKRKRVRVPDILCIKCVRKSNPEPRLTLLSPMSHSTSDPSRYWDYGLETEDRVALVVCKKTGDGPIDWDAEKIAQYAEESDLRNTRETNLTGAR